MFTFKFLLRKEKAVGCMDQLSLQKADIEVCFCYNLSIIVLTAFPNVRLFYRLVPYTLAFHLRTRMGASGNRASKSHMIPQNGEIKNSKLLSCPILITILVSVF